MRKLLILILAAGMFLVVSPFIRLSVPAAPIPQILAPIVTGVHKDTSLVGWWSLGEGTGTTAYDYSGSNLTATWSGTQVGTSGYYSPGYGQTWAGAFDGSTTQLHTSANLPLIGATGTFCVWINPNSYWVNFANFIWGGGWKLSVFQTSGALCFFDGAHTLYGGTITSGAWNFLCVTVNSGTGIGYINASPVFSGTVNNPLETGAGPVHFGYGDHYYYGLEQNARVYNRTLSAAEVAYLYAGGNP